MRFFFDNCISIRYVRALRILAEFQKYELAHLSEKFDVEGVKDAEWISVLAKEGGWAIVSGDPRITRGKIERAAWRESGLTGFFFSDGWASRGLWTQAEDLVHWWPQIVLEARNAIPGSGYLLPFRGKKMQKVYEPD